MQLDEKDHQVLQKLHTRHAVPASLAISHADKTEPLLVIADVLAGARSDDLCFADQQAYPLLAHRVRQTTPVFD